MNFELNNIKDNNKSEVIRFLNSKASDFYSGKTKFMKNTFIPEFKTLLLNGICEIERSIKGSFDCDLFLKNADVEMLKEMYPNICEMFDIKSQDKVINLGRFLECLRNINGHAFSSDSDMLFFKNDFSFLENQKCFNSDIKYYNKKITIAGIVFLLINFLREKSIETLSKNSRIISLISSGDYVKDDGKKFVSEISHTNLEILIRTENGNNMFESIFGRYCDIVEFNKFEYKLSIGSPENPTYKVSGLMDGNKIKVNRYSLTKTFYIEDYELIIEEQDGFVELSNQLPPFVLIDYLYETNVKIFNSTEYAKILKTFDLLLKLNKPKFYIDKNLQTILLPSTVSNFRIVSAATVDALQKILLSLENKIYRIEKINRSNDYSKTIKALYEIGMPTQLLDDVMFIRNFVFHGRLLNETMYFNNEHKQLTMPMIISTLAKLDNFLKTNNEIIYLTYTANVKHWFVEILMSVNYKKPIEYTAKYLNDYPSVDTIKLHKSISCVDNASLNILELMPLYNNKYEYKTIAKFNKLDDGEILYLYEDGIHVSPIEDFCNKNGYNIVLKKDNILLKEYDLEKK